MPGDTAVYVERYRWTPTIAIGIAVELTFVALMAFPYAAADPYPGDHVLRLTWHQCMASRPAPRGTSPGSPSTLTVSLTR